MAHARTKLTPLGRRLPVDRVLVCGWTLAEAARAPGVSRPTCYKAASVRKGLPDSRSGPVDPTAGPTR